MDPYFMVKDVLKSMGGVEKYLEKFKEGGFDDAKITEMYFYPNQKHQLNDIIIANNERRTFCMLLTNFMEMGIGTVHECYGPGAILKEGQEVQYVSFTIKVPDGTIRHEQFPKTYWMQHFIEDLQWKFRTKTTQVDLVFNGKRIKYLETPESAAIKDGDQLEIIEEPCTDYSASSSSSDDHDN